MGIDAPSTDLTARIQARRRALVLDGAVEPALPGERVIYGKQPGAHDRFEVTGGAQVRAAEMRSRRERASDAVVEMDYTDYRAAGDADEPFEVGAGDEELPEVVAVDPHELLEEDGAEHEESAAFEYAERLITTDVAALELRLAGIEAALALLSTDLGERLDGLGEGFLALAKGLSEELAAIRASTATPCDVPPAGWYCTRDKGHDGPCAALEVPPRRRWWHFLIGYSGPYE